MKWILSIILSSTVALTGFIDPPKRGQEVSQTLLLQKDAIEIFTEEGGCTILSTSRPHLEKEFVAKGGILDPMRKIDLKTGGVIGYPLNLRKIAAENKIAFVSSKGTTRAAVAWHVLKNAGYSNLWSPSGVKNGIDTVIPLTNELEGKGKSVEIEDPDFEEIKKFIASEDREYQSIYQEKNPIFTDRHGLAYERISRIGENWTEQFNPRFIVDGEVNKEALLHRKILRERLEHEYYIPIIQNKNVVITLSDDAYHGMILRLTEVAIKYDLSLDGVRVIPILVDEIESTSNFEHYIDSFRDLIGFSRLYN